MACGEALTIQTAECLFLQAALPGRLAENAGVLLLDPATDRLHIRLRRDWSAIAAEEDAEVLALLEDDLKRKAAEMGGAALVAWLEESASNLVRVSGREAVQLADFEARLNRLYRENVQSRRLEFETHLPLYSLRAAAGKLSPENEVEAEDWVETPAGLDLSADMFVARVAGRSMEPKIPGGSLCVFRRGAAGSRQGRLLLIQRPGADRTAEFTIKRYTSVKKADGDSWAHELIRLEPLNPEFEAWNLSPDEFSVVGEFVRVLPPEE
ncbi:MAG: LexA family transcriptional regulator [Acidobacteria bacterium]|nr:LexA family transcriptional regulator [Acidobacteriota bacterium]